MAIAATHLTATTGSGSSHATASISPGANRLILVAVAIFNGGALPSISSVSGNGITYTLVTSTDEINGGFGPYKLFLYRGLSASPSAGAITVSLSDTTAQIDISVADVSGVDTGGTNGSAAVVQSALTTVDNASPMTVTLSAFGDVGNGAFGAALSYDAVARTPGSGWTELDETTQIQTQWRADNDTTCDWTWSGGDTAIALAIEIKAGAAPPAGGGMSPGIYKASAHILGGGLVRA